MAAVVVKRLHPFAWLVLLWMGLLCPIFWRECITMSLWRKVLNADSLGVDLEDPMSVATAADRAKKCGFPLIYSKGKIYVYRSDVRRGVVLDEVPIKLDTSDVWSCIFCAASDETSEKALHAAAEDAAWFSYPMMLFDGILYLVLHTGDCLPTQISEADLITSKDIISAVHTLDKP